MGIFVEGLDDLLLAVGIAASRKHSDVVVENRIVAFVHHASDELLVGAAGGDQIVLVQDRGDPSLPLFVIVIRIHVEGGRGRRDPAVDPS